MRVLVADGSAKSRGQLVKIIRDAGHRVAAASTGADAFHAYEENPAEIVFIDWSLPDMSGTELCRILRDYNLKTGLVAYLVLVTGRSKKRSMVDGLDAGADDFVLKPFSKEVLLSRLSVAKMALGTKVNRIPRLRPSKEKTIEPVEVLNREHVMVRKMAGILEVVANMLAEGRPLPKKLLDWASSSAFVLNWQLHEEKEMFYIDLFIERAREIHGKTAQLYTRSSLIKIMNEHKTIKRTLGEMQEAARRYNINNRETARELREIIGRYLPLIRFHAAREEDVFLPLSQRYLNQGDVSRIMQDFARIDGEVGKDTLDARLETLDRLERILSIRGKDA